MNDKNGKIFRIVAIILMGLTAVMNLAGGIGTVCAAFLTREYPPMWALLDYQWLYQILMIVTIALGLAGAWVTFRLFRGGVHVYRNALIVLGAGALVGGIHMAASLMLRGAAVPANVKFYINLVTFVVFLVLGTPALRAIVRFDRPGDRTDMTAAGGMAAIVTGAALLSINVWAGSSHTFEGINWIDRLGIPLYAAGTVLILVGLAALIKALGALLSAPESLVVPGETGRR